MLLSGIERALKTYSKFRSEADCKLTRTWEEKKPRKAYSFWQGDYIFLALLGEPSWTSYRYQLEQLTDRTKGRETMCRVDNQDSIGQIKTLGCRTTST